MHTFRFSVPIIGFSFLLTSVASASVFPDVPDGHTFQQPIERLVGSSVINGNPDGNFYPNRAVNRAELLKMLYLAAGKSPDVSSVRCFPDVVPGSWYESYVCDAAANKYVNGYPDGFFKPGQDVNRVEALKMITNILGIDVEEIDPSARETVKFVDVSVSAWYTKYLYAAYAKDILPIAGMDTSRFKPESPLLRGEAAAMIYNAINVELNQQRSQQQSSSSSSPSLEDSSSSNESSSSSLPSSSSSAHEVSLDVSYPFDTGGKFSAKLPYTYIFSLSAPTTVYTEVTVSTGEASCRLYLMRDDGFSDEYYLGHQEGSKCYMLTALSVGRYQLQLEPTVADATFTVKTSTMNGDGNDGFREAKRLLLETPKTAVLDVNDIKDYYMFTVTDEKNLTLETTNNLEIRCVIFPMRDVDLFGFEGPTCNQTYKYPTGTYYVAISRSIASKTSKKSYTLTLR